MRNASGRCAFCDAPNALRLFCTRCVPPLRTFASQAEYQFRYSQYYAAIGRGYGRPPQTRIPSSHPAYTHPPTKPKRGLVCRICDGRREDPAERYCSDKCRIQAIAESIERSNRNLKRHQVVHECQWCWKPFDWDRARPIKFCGMDCGQRYAHNVKQHASPNSCRLPVCVDCHRVFGAAPAFYGQHPPVCTECKGRREIARNYGKNVSRRSKRMTTKGIDRAQLGERDGWICWLCEQHVDKTLKYPDRMSASIDHVVPISHGGLDAWHNVRLAHWICNVRRSDRPAPCRTAAASTVEPSVPTRAADNALASETSNEAANNNEGTDQSTNVLALH